MTSKRLIYQDNSGYKNCVPRVHIDEVIRVYHDVGHPALHKLMTLLARRFIFSIKQKDLHHRCWTVCHFCQICQAVKPRRGKVPGTMDFCPIPQEIFTSLCMDFVDLEKCKSPDGNLYDCAFVIVCRLSGYIVAIPCKKEGLTAKRLAELFLSNCVNFMGLPNEIVSDNDHLISSSFFKTLCELVGIEQHFSIIYRPKGNGRAECNHVVSNRRHSRSPDVSVS